MMKAVLMSIQPKWSEKIANGEKTIEVRKSRPKLETPFKVYIYCTNNKRQYLRKLGTPCQEVFITENRDVLGRTDKVKSIIGEAATFWESSGYNGKVIGEFVCNGIYEWKYRSLQGIKGAINTYFPIFVEDLPKTCLTHKDLETYGKGKTLYGWRISQLKIYRKPKELSEFKHDTILHTRFNGYKEPLKKPPQSWCYVEELQNGH